MPELRLGAVLKTLLPLPISKISGSASAQHFAITKIWRFALNNMTPDEKANWTLLTADPGFPAGRGQPQRGSANLLLPPATKLGQGSIFTGVCDSVHGGCLVSGGVPGLRGGCLVPGGFWSGGAWWRPPPDGYCCGRYASCWNAVLFGQFFLKTGGPSKILLCRSATGSVQDLSVARAAFPHKQVTRADHLTATEGVQFHIIS